MSKEMGLVEMIVLAEKVGKEMKELNATYLYDGVYVYHDGFQYWLCTEQGDKVAMEPRTMEMFREYIEKREGKI